MWSAHGSYLLQAPLQTTLRNHLAQDLISIARRITVPVQNREYSTLPSSAWRGVGHRRLPDSSNRQAQTCAVTDEAAN